MPRKATNKTQTQTQTVVKFESDNEIRERLAERFRVIELMGTAACRGEIRSLVISGPAGLGKSHTIMEALHAYDPEQKKTVVLSGFTRATGIYKMLHDYRHPGNVIVFDDCDVFKDVDTLNLIKAACDTTKDRRIYWGSETKMTDDKGQYLPNTFDFNGTVIFITNQDFDKAIDQDTKLAVHFEAMISRSHYIDTSMKCERDYLIRIEQVVENGMLKARGFNKFQEKALLKFVNDNHLRLRELTLRLVVKLADLMVSQPNDWQSIAQVTLFKSKV